MKTDLYILINSSGLLLDIIGVILLFIYGLPSKFNTPPTLLVEGDITDKQKTENNTIEYRAKLGLICLILGFIFQFISNFL